MKKVGEALDTLNAQSVSEALRVLEVVYRNSDTSPTDILDSFQISGLSIKKSVQVYAAFMHRNADTDIVEFLDNGKRRSLWKGVQDGV